MNDDVDTCGATAVHPTHDLVGCELPAGHDGLHQLTVEGEAEPLQWEDIAEDDVPAFDVEAFVKALPEGVALCPTCLGMGGVVEEPPFDPTTHTCTVCQGRGRTRTGSLKSNEAERDCVACGGRGWLPNDPGELPAGPARAIDFAQPAPVDFAGRTPDDPEFDWSRVARDVEPVVVEPEPAPA